MSWSPVSHQVLGGAGCPSSSREASVILAETDLQEHTVVGFLSAKVWRVERAEGLGAVLAAVREPGWACRREHPCATQLGPLRLLPRKSLLTQLFPGTSFP